MAGEAGRKVIIAMDGSKHAEFALRYFKDNIHRENDDVIVIYSLEYGSYVPSDREGKAAKEREEMGAALNMLAPGEAEVSDASLRKDCIALFSADPQFQAHLAEEEDKEVRGVLDTLTSTLTQLGIKGRVQKVSANRPGEGVVKAASEMHADLIVTGTRGMGTLRRTVLGSVSQYIVHHSHVPVLVACHEK